MFSLTEQNTFNKEEFYGRIKFDIITLLEVYVQIKPCTLTIILLIFWLDFDLTLLLVIIIYLFYDSYLFGIFFSFIHKNKV